ncbi:hypothetical protein [Gorillibacterium sp. CAU 1737]|uniref:phage adaptor protein n=1 Tax=Gorillibacterium sp. CAU 1737 TaxID=3140362 RepID=UPI00325FF7CF
MSIVQTLLADIKLRYRHTFTDAQVLVWMNEEKRELYEILQKDSSPYALQTLEGVSFYPLPEIDEIEKIKVVTLQVNDQPQARFQEVPFKRNDDNVDAYVGTLWYTIINDGMYINIPGGAKDDRYIYIYCDESSEDILAVTDDSGIPKKWEEVLKLGTLKRIALARKDIEMSNNYDLERESKIADFEWQMKMSEPEFVTPVSTLPRRPRRGTTQTYFYSW